MIIMYVLGSFPSGPVYTESFAGDVSCQSWGAG